MKKISLKLGELFADHRKMQILLCIAGAFSILAGAVVYILIPSLLQHLPSRSFDALIYYRTQMQFLCRAALYCGIAAFAVSFFYSKNCDWGQLLTLGAFLTGAALRLDCCFSRELWNDTLSLAVWLKERSFIEVLSGTGANSYCQSAPPAFAVLSKVIGEVAGYKNYTLNIMPMLFSLAGLCYFRTLAGKLLTPFGAVAALWLFALNPGAYFYAGEFKQYSGDIFFTIMILSQTVDYVKAPEKFPWCMVVCGVTGAFFSHAMFFILPAAGIAMLLSYRRIPFRHLAGVAAIWIPTVLLLALWTRAVMPEGMYVHEHHIHGFAPLPNSIANLKWYGKTLVELFISPWGLSWKFAVFSLLPLAGMCNGIVHLYRSNRVFPDFFLFTMALLLIASVLHQYSLAAGAPFAKSRLILFTIPPALICFVKGVEVGKWRYLLLPTAFFCVLNVTTSFMTVARIVPAVKALEQFHKPGSKVYVNTVAAECAVKLYSKSPEKYGQLIRVKFDEIPADAEGSAVFADIPHGQIKFGKCSRSIHPFGLSTFITIGKKNDH